MAEMLIVAGQSNALTRGVSGEPLPSLWKPGYDIQFWDGLRFKTYMPELQDYWGPEVGYAMARRHSGVKEHLYIVKHAVGNTQLGAAAKYGDLTSNDEPDWFPTTQDGLFDQLSEKVARAKHDKRGIDSFTILWIQGEADTRSAKSAEDYRDNCLYLYRKMRYGFASLTTKIISSTVSPLVYPKEFIESQREVAKAHRLNFIVETDQFKYQSDRIHLSRNSAIQLGREAWDISN